MKTWGTDECKITCRGLSTMESISYSGCAIMRSTSMPRPRVQSAFSHDRRPSTRGPLGVTASVAVSKTFSFYEPEGVSSLQTIMQALGSPTGREGSTTLVHPTIEPEASASHLVLPQMKITSWSAGIFSTLLEFLFATSIKLLSIILTRLEERVSPSHCLIILREGFIPLEASFERRSDFNRVMA